MTSNIFIQIIHNRKRIKIEVGCTSCVFGEFDDDMEPCATCYRISTAEEIPFSQWLFDPNFGTGDEDTTSSNSKMLPMQQKIGLTTIAEAVSTAKRIFTKV